MGDETRTFPLSVTTLQLLRGSSFMSDTIITYQVKFSFRALSKEDTSEGYKVLGKIRYPSAIRGGTNDFTEGSDIASSEPDAASNPSVMCFVCLDPTRKRIVGLHGHGLQEVVLCYRLLERYSVPRKVLDEPLPFNAR